MGHFQRGVHGTDGRRCDEEAGRNGGAGTQCSRDFNPVIIEYLGRFWYSFTSSGGWHGDGAGHPHRGVRRQRDGGG